MLTTTPPSDPNLLWVDFHSLPIAALYLADQRVVAVNAAYEQLTSVQSADIVGRNVAELITSFVIADDVLLVDGASKDSAHQGDFWCRVTDLSGTTRTVRVLRRPAPNRRSDDEYVVYLLPADTDAYERVFAERLANAAASLLRCTDEDSVLVCAAEVLSNDKYTVTILLLHEGDPLLAYGPTRSPGRSSINSGFESVRPPREVLTRLNPRFFERRAAFFQHPAETVRVAYPEAIASQITQHLPGRRMVQAPLFVADEPYGALCVTDDRLTHVSVGTLEMYAQLVGAAIENVRLHHKARLRLEESERLQAELLQRERLAALGEAAAVMAHEVRNPIGSIMNAVALLEREKTTGTSDTELHRIIAEEAVRLERLVSDLLALGRPLVPRVQETNLAEVAESAATILRTRRELGGCVIDRVSSDGSRAAVDPELIQIALLNVIRNAIEASPPNGHIRMTAHADGPERAAIAIEDDGAGVDAAVAKRMLEPFFTTRATGTGVGLAVVRRILEATGGTFSVDRGESGGARITLHFPAWRA